MTLKAIIVLRVILFFLLWWQATNLWNCSFFYLMLPVIVLQLHLSSIVIDTHLEKFESRVRQILQLTS